MDTVQMQYSGLERADRIWHLRQTGLMDGLSVADLKAIAAVCRDRIYVKGDVIFNQGDPVDYLYVLNRGCVLVSVVNAHDREKILAIYTNGEIFGENVLGAEEDWRTRATAHEECWISAISREHFLSLIQQRTAIALNYLRILSQRLVESREDIEAQSFLDTELRLVKTLLKLATVHGKPVFGMDNMVKLKISLSHEHLARLIGGNRPHVSMIMSKFRKKGWLNYQSRKLLINVPVLERRLRPFDQP